MSRTAGRRSNPVLTGAIALVLAAGFWCAVHTGLITKPTSCGRHLTITTPKLVTRQVRLDKVKTKDGHIIAVQGTDTATGESVTMNTIRNNHPNEPTTPGVRKLRSGETYTLILSVFTETDTTAGCPGPKVYDYIVGINFDHGEHRIAA
jgi:hypothetical protein